MCASQQAHCSCWMPKVSNARLGFWCRWTNIGRHEWTYSTRFERSCCTANDPLPPLTPQQRRRIQLALRTLDARRDRASYQTIARHLYGAEAVSREHWKTSSIKAKITRLSAHGTHLTTKGYRFLLLGKGPTGRSKPRK